MKYTVYYKVNARFKTEVEANNIEDAIEKTSVEFSDADFGDAYNIDGVPLYTEDDINGMIPLRH